MNESLIIVERNFVSFDDCDALKNAFDVLQHFAVKREYEERNNTIGEAIFISNELNNNKSIEETEKSQLQEIDNMLVRIINSFIIKILQPLFRLDNLSNLLDTDFQDSGYELRKLTGSTRLHVDNIQPTTNRANSSVFIRFGSITIVLNDTEDSIVFPLQKRGVSMEKGSVIFFPPFWTHPHYTNYMGIPRYTVQTWLIKTHTLINTDF